ncbi:MAG: hypothetical protein ACKVWR_21985 [Acidimicrobiales bacterium]
MTCRTGTLLRLAATALEDYALDCTNGWTNPRWVITTPDDLLLDRGWHATPQDALLAAIEHHWGG